MTPEGVPAAAAFLDGLVRVRVYGGRAVHSVTRHAPPSGRFFHSTTCNSHHIGAWGGDWRLPPDTPVTCKACIRVLERECR